MKRRSRRGGVGLLLGLLLWVGCGKSATSPETARQPVVFADSALEEAIVRRLEGQSPLPSALAAIEQLDASGLGISDLSGIEALTGVRDLDLSDNRLEDIAPLAGLEKLVFLDLSGNRIADIGALGGLALLRDLRLADNRIVEIAPLASLTGLAFIDLARNELVDLQSLAGLDSLQTLTLSANRVRELTPLLGLGGLTHLDLEDNPLPDDVRADQLQALRQKGVQVLWRPPLDRSEQEEAEPAPFALSVVARLPDGREDIYLLDLEGGAPFNLTREPARYWDLAWSRDGTRLAYAAARTEDGRGNHIYIIDADGGNKTRLSQRSGLRPQRPAFAPDGRSLAYSQLLTASGPSHVFVLDLESGEPTDLTPQAQWAVAPQWAPDGTSLAYVDAVNLGQNHLRLVRADGSQDRVLGADIGGIDALSWALDGSGLYCAVYGGADDPSGADIYRYDLAAGRLTNLTKAEGYDVFPTLGPAGERIAFLHYLQEEGGLFVMQVQTGERRLVVDAAALGFVGAPQWSADGRWLVFSADGDGLYLVEAAGGGWRDVLFERLRLDRLFGGPPVFAWIPRP